MRGQQARSNRSRFYSSCGHCLTGGRTTAVQQDQIQEKCFHCSSQDPFWVIPYALKFGAPRGILFWWQLIDCSFGVYGAVPLWLARRLVTRCHTMSPD
jgi:hypothetical protein